MENDQGIPGNRYFEYPKVIDIAIVRNGNNVSTLDPSSCESPVRLASSVGMRDFNRKEPVTYGLSLRPTSAQKIGDYLKQKEIEGFGLGAVVARRWCADWRYQTCFEWGAIMGVKTYCLGSHEPGFYAPFIVRWFNRNMNEEGAWPEDLYLIHQALSKNLLESIIEDQQPEVIVT
jgi:hypothetical protein